MNRLLYSYYLKGGGDRGRPLALAVNIADIATAAVRLLKCRGVLRAMDVCISDIQALRKFRTRFDPSYVPGWCRLTLA